MIDAGFMPTGDQPFDDILYGKYDKNGFKIYRVFRDDSKKILKCVFIKDGTFKEITLQQTLDGDM